MIEIFSIFKSERASHLTGQPSLKFNPCVTMSEVHNSRSTLSPEKLKSLSQHVLKNLTHGATLGREATAEYTAWIGMKGRCYNPNDGKFYRYGARGITVCDRWVNSFENFLEDMGTRPSPKHSLHRKENDENYDPQNCVWATPKEQARARRSNRIVEFRGESLILIEWSERLNMSWDVLWARLKLGWTVERAFTQPVRKSPRK